MKRSIGNYECEIEEYDPEYIVVKFEDDVMHQPHQLMVPKRWSDEEIADYIHKYLYGYDEDGRHFPGYFDMWGGKK